MDELLNNEKPLFSLSVYSIHNLFKPFILPAMSTDLDTAAVYTEEIIVPFSMSVTAAAGKQIIGKAVFAVLWCHLRGYAGMGAFDAVQAENFAYIVHAFNIATLEISEGMGYKNQTALLL